MKKKKIILIIIMFVITLILIGLLIGVVILTFSIVSICNAVKNKNITSGYLNKYVSEISYKELDTYLLEPASNTFVYITYTGDENIYKLEKGLKKIINNNEELVIQTNERDQTKEQIEIKNEYINIRSDYDSSSELLGKVYKDEIYTVLEKQEDEYYTWCKIETTNGIVGYIAVKYQEENYVEFLEIVDEEIEEE